MDYQRNTILTRHDEMLRIIYEKTKETHAKINELFLLLLNGFEMKSQKNSNFEY